MKNNLYAKFFYYTFGPLVILAMLAVVPVTRAAEAIPESNQVALNDTTFPGDVENVKAVAGDSSVTLNWDVATDNVGVKGYKIYYGQKSVTNEGGSYAFGPVDVGNKITYTVGSLLNGKKYYFTVTAYDAAGNESGNYSSEVSATPVALKAVADSEAPKVSKAEATDKQHVKVTFSEAVQLPLTAPQSAFNIKNENDNTQLEVKNAIMDVSDTANLTVILVTADQQAGASYVLTVGIDVKDVANNPIISGTSDTAPFTGTDILPNNVQVASNQETVAQNTAPIGPQFTSITAKDGTHLEVVFSKAVVLKADKRENFTITEDENHDNVLDVTAVEVDSTGTKVTLTTAPQKAIKYNLIALDVSDSDQNPMSLENNATKFMGIADAGTLTPVEDQTPPEDATAFTAAMIKKLIVTLNWVKSLNSSNDLANYVLYLSKDGSNFGNGTAVDPQDTTFDVTDLSPGVKYFFKLTAKDTTGNESAGVMTNFTLPATGPELAFLFLGSLGLGKLSQRKKKKLLKK